MKLSFSSEECDEATLHSASESSQFPTAVPTAATALTTGLAVNTRTTPLALAFALVLRPGQQKHGNVNVQGDCESLLRHGLAGTFALFAFAFAYTLVGSLPDKQIKSKAGARPSTCQAVLCPRLHSGCMSLAGAALGNLLRFFARGTWQT